MTNEEMKREGIKCAIASTTMILAAVALLGFYPGTRQLGEIFIKFLTGLGWFIILVIPLIWNHPGCIPPEPKEKPKWTRPLNIVARSAVVAALFVAQDYILMAAFILAMVLSKIVLDKMYAR